MKVKIGSNLLLKKAFYNAMYKVMHHYNISFHMMPEIYIDCIIDGLNTLCNINMENEYLGEWGDEYINFDSEEDMFLFIMEWS